MASTATDATTTTTPITAHKIQDFFATVGIAVSGSRARDLLDSYGEYGNEVRSISKSANGFSTGGAGLGTGVKTGRVWICSVGVVDR